MAERYTKHHTEKSLLYDLYNNYAKSNYYFSRNKYIFNGPSKLSWESDGFYQTKSGLTYELEIKKSRSDWAKERKDKERKHKFLLDVYESSGEILKNPKYNPEKKNSKLYNYYAPNYFIMVCQEGLIMPEEVEEAFPYGGLKWVTDSGRVKTKLRAKLHPLKQNLNDVLLEKFYWRTSHLEYELYKNRKIYRNMDKKSLQDPEKVNEFLINMFKDLKI